VAVGALPAHAGPPAVQISAPAPGSQSRAETVSIQGSATATAPGASITGALSVQITSPEGHPGYSDSVPGWCGRSACSFTLTSGALPYNGAYNLTVSAQETDPPTGQVQTSSSFSSFSVSAPPEAPSGVTARPAGDGSSITVTWNPNPEPDLVGYEVSRSPSDGAGTGAGPGATGGGGGSSAVTGTSYVDSDVTPGDSYTYSVNAVRRGATPGSTLSSAPSSTTVTDTVPASDSSPSSGTSAGSASPGPGAAGTASGSGAHGQATSGAGSSGAGSSPSSGAGNAHGPGGTAASHSLSTFDSLVQATADARPSASGTSSFPAVAAPGLPALAASGVAPGSDNPMVAPFSSGSLNGAQAAGAMTVSYDGGGSKASAVRDFAAVGLAALLLAVATHVLWLRRRARAGPAYISAFGSS
jgi:hypothetical protein